MNDQNIRATAPELDSELSAQLESNSMRVLIGEPDPQRRLTYASVLQGAGYAVSDVSDVESVLAETARSFPSLIIFRLSEPYSDGFDLCRAIRSDADTRDLPVIVLTKNDDAYLREQVVRSGGTAILSEPLKATLLLRQVRRLLSRSRPRTCCPAMRPCAERRGDALVSSSAR